MRHLLSFATAILCGAVLAPAQSFTVDVLNYTVLSADDHTVSVSGHAETLPDQLVIPSTVSYEGTEYTVTELGRMALMNTTITGIVLPPTLTKIGYGSLRNCKITSLTLPPSVTVIDGYAMQLCKFTTLTIEDGDQPISIYPYSLPTGTSYYLYLGRNPLYFNDEGEPADPVWDVIPFSGSSGLKDLVIGPEVTELPKESFYNSPRLETLVIQPGKLESLSDRLFYGNKKLKEVKLPETLTNIGNSTFRNCPELTGIVIPSSVTTLGVSVFDGCTSLKTATLPSAIETIPASIFSNCALTSITIPANISSIEYDAFAGCPLTEIKCRPIIPPTVDESSFKDFSATLYVLNGCEEAYKNAATWKKFTNIIPVNDFSAIEEIAAGEGPVKVYNLNGTCVLEGELSTISSLQAGIYIVKLSTGECVKVSIR